MINSANWIGENTSTVGTGDIELNGALLGFAPFSVLEDGSQVYYTIQDGLQKETGIGTVSRGFLQRTTVQATIDVNGVYLETAAPISLSGTAQVFGIINADFIKRFEKYSDNADILSTLTLNGEPIEPNADINADTIGAARQGVNDDITEIIGLEKPLDISMGGTGATTLEDGPFLGKQNNFADVPDKIKAWENLRPANSGLPLSTDATQPNHAVTKRQLDSVVSGGPLAMIMSNFVGAVEWWQGSRTMIPTGYAAYDGQLINRSDPMYGPVVAAVINGILPSVTDSVWLSDPSQRCKYSTGDGSTTIRLPDLNGVQDGSIQGLFLRGVSDTFGTGVVQQSAAPNITGQTEYTVLSLFSAPGATLGKGAIVPTVMQSSLTGGGGVGTYGSFEFNASLSNAVYGRSSSEIRPNSATGIWVGRVNAIGGNIQSEFYCSGGLDDGTPGAIGGMIASTAVDASGNPTSIAGFQLQRGDDGYAKFIFAVLDKITGSTSSAYVDAVGNLGGIAGIQNVGDIQTDGNVDITGLLACSDNFTIANHGFPRMILKPNTAASGTIGAQTLFEASVINSSNPTVVSLIRRNAAGSTTGQIDVKFPTTAGTIALQGTSGREYKEEIVHADLMEAVNRILSLEMVNFVYKDDEQRRVRFGVIAEDAEVNCPQYVKHNPEAYESIFDHNGDFIGYRYRDRPSIDTNPIVMDLLGMNIKMYREMEIMKQQIQNLLDSQEQ